MCQKWWWIREETRRWGVFFITHLCALLRRRCRRLDRIDSQSSVAWPRTLPASCLSLRRAFSARNLSANSGVLQCALLDRAAFPISIEVSSMWKYVGPLGGSNDLHLVVPSLRIPTQNLWRPNNEKGESHFLGKSGGKEGGLPYIQRSSVLFFNDPFNPFFVILRVLRRFLG